MYVLRVCIDAYMHVHVCTCCVYVCMYMLYCIVLSFYFNCIIVYKYCMYGMCMYDVHFVLCCMYGM